MIRYCSALLICASLAGCMTVPVDVETGPRAPASAFLDPSLLQSAPDKGEIRIARDAGVSGRPSMCSFIWMADMWSMSMPTG